MVKATPPIRNADKDADLDFDHGTFDSAGFAAQALRDWQSLAAAIDHMLLDAEATRAQVESLCDEAARYGFASAVVNPLWAATAVSMLAGTGVAVGVAIGFPLGATLASTLRQEAATLIRMGVRELEMVLPIGQLKSGNYQAVERTVHAVVNVTRHGGAVLKVTLETSLLNTEEKLRGAEIAIRAGADFISTSTGFSTSGASVADVALMRGVAGGRCGVKALGGVRTVSYLRTLLEAGANRIGASGAVAMVREMGAA